MPTQIPDKGILPDFRKIIFVVIGGLGGLAMPGAPRTELETASTPNLDSFAAEGTCGLVDPILPGVTCGSGPAQLSLLGYDSTRLQIDRGVLTALGIDFKIKPGDVAFAVNFCTVDEMGIITDRRAGRIPFDLCQSLCRKISKSVKIDDDIQFFLEPVADHHALLVLRGDRLGARVSDTDPLVVGKVPQTPRGTDQPSTRTAAVLTSFLEQAAELLKVEYPANFMILRGASRLSLVPSLAQRYRLKAVAISSDPLTRGVARCVGMKVLEASADEEDIWRLLTEVYQDYDFFYVNFKKPDTAGEKGDFGGRVTAFQEIDLWAGQVRTLKPTVLVVTGDHSTPAVLKSHSWHPVPTLIWSPTCRRDEVVQFGEGACARGGLGRMPGKHLLRLALAHAGRTSPVGA